MADVIDLNPPRPVDHGAVERQWTRRCTDVGRGRLPWRMAKPTIYFAGRMDASDSGGNNSDWRNDLGGFTGLCGTVGYCDPSEINPDTRVDCLRFYYGGPFALDTTGGHTVGHCGRFDDDDSYSPTAEHQRIWDTDKAWIARADLVLAYLDDAQAYGTLVEIGFAAALGKPIALGFSDDLNHADYDELWLCRMTASKVYWGTSQQIWAEVQNDWIR